VLAPVFQERPHDPAQTPPVTRIARPHRAKLRRSCLANSRPSNTR
jgi:hypothetical protein